LGEWVGTVCRIIIIIIIIIIINRPN
jgi:hypothetical protein